MVQARSLALGMASSAGRVKVAWNACNSRQGCREIVSEPRRQCGNCRLVIRRVKMRRQGSRDGTVRNFQRGPIFKNNARQKLNFTSKSKRYEAAARLFQHFSFVFSEAMPLSLSSRLKKRGVSRTSRYARRDAVDVDGVARRVATSRTAKSWGPGAAMQVPRAWKNFHARR